MAPAEALAGATEYHRPPSPAPSGKPAIAACWAAAVASAGPSVAIPGVSCLKVSAPTPAATTALARSAAATRVEA